MKLLRSLICGAALALTSPVFAQAVLDGHGPDAWQVTGVASNDVLNLRAGPSTDYPRIGRLTYNARGVEMLVCVPTLTMSQFQMLTDDGYKFPPRWCLVKRGAEQGWANARFLQEDSAAAPSAGPEATAPDVVAEFIQRWAIGDFLADPWQLEDYTTPQLAAYLRSPPGADPVFDANDFDITDIRLTWGEPPLLRGMAQIVAEYRNFGHPERLHFSLVREPGGNRYVISEIDGPYGR